MAVDGEGPLLHARVGMLRALNRHVEREFNPDWKRPIGEGGNWRGIGDSLFRTPVYTDLWAPRWESKKISHRRFSQPGGGFFRLGREANIDGTTAIV